MKYLAILFLPLAAAALADEVIIKIPDGVRYIKVTGDNLRVTRATVIDLDDGPTTPPKPPTDKFGLAKLAKDEAAKVDDPQTQAGIGAIYQLLAEQIEAGTIKNPQTAATAAKTAVDLFLTQTSKKTEWAAFRGAIKARLDALAKKGEIKTVQDVAQAYSEIAAGLRSESEAISPELLALILRIIEIVLQLLGGN